ncbi:MAG: FtsQ-type POTRA domain-containing protein [Patescibacteria group bacterium]
MRFRTTVHHQYGNALFAQGVRRAWVARHPRWFIAILCSITIGALYCSYGLSYWQVRTLTIQGTYTLSTPELRELTLRQMQGHWLLAFKQTNLWAFDVAAYERRLRERWIFSELTVSRKLPNTLALTLTEEKPALYYLTGTQVFGIDQHGLASTLVTEAPKNIPLLTFVSPPANVSVGQMLLAQNDANFFQTWVHALQTRAVPSLVATTIQASSPPDTLARIRVAGEWEIVVDRTQPAQLQIDAFFTAYDQKLQGRPLQYVDVTVPARVYFK